MNLVAVLFRSLSVLLVSCYLLIQTGWDFVHQTLHRHEVVQHTLLMEKDACHRSVFHGEKDAHKHHIVATKGCVSCHVSTSPSIPAEPASFNLANRAASVLLVFVHAQVTDTTPGSVPARAPPICS